MQAINLTELVREFGLGVALVIGLAFAAWYTLYRLFAKNDGILTRVSDRHIQFLDSTEQQQFRLTNATEDLATTSKIAAENLKILGESRDNLHRAASHACDFLEHVAQALEIEEHTKHSIQNIRAEIAAGSLSETQH